MTPGPSRFPRAVASLRELVQVLSGNEEDLLVTELEEVLTSLVFSLLDGDGVGHFVGDYLDVTALQLVR